MRQTTGFFLYCAIVFFLVLVATIVTQFILHVPMAIEGPVSGVKIQSVLIPGRELSYTTNRATGSMTLLDRSLELNNASNFP